MKVLHFANLGRRKSGLYECCKDQIKYERKYGIDSQLAIYEQENPPKNWVDDDWLRPVGWDWAEQADLYIIHRGLPNEVEKKFPKKKIMIIHGNAEYLILDEIVSEAERQNINVHINLINNCDAAVAVNPHDYKIYKLYDANNKLELIHDAIDVDRFSLEGYSHPFLNHPQIIYADSLRVNKHPAHIIWAMPEICKIIPEAKLTVLGLKLTTILTWRNLILRTPGNALRQYLENIQLEVTELRPFLRGADILYNGNMSGIPSRVEMEAMACGCQVISFNGEFSKWHPIAFDIDDIAQKVIDCWKYIQQNPEKAKQEVRDYAVKYFNMETQVKDKYIPLYKKVLESK